MEALCARCLEPRVRQDATNRVSFLGGVRRGRASNDLFVVPARRTLEIGGSPPGAVGNESDCRPRRLVGAVGTSQRWTGTPGRGPLSQHGLDEPLGLPLVCGW